MSESPTPSTISSFSTSRSNIISSTNELSFIRSNESSINSFESTSLKSTNYNFNKDNDDGISIKSNGSNGKTLNKFKNILNRKRSKSLINPSFSFSSTNSNTEYELGLGLTRPNSIPSTTPSPSISSPIVSNPTSRFKLKRNASISSILPIFNTSSNLNSLSAPPSITSSNSTRDNSISSFSDMEGSISPLFKINENETITSKKIVSQSQIIKNSSVKDEVLDELADEILQKVDITNNVVNWDI
ncbi:hypothetical protein WICMUC_001374 [Wickerhamomyces mucosus]|uniref:Uncharacterized protein n=1 Tax=Wickerhamomyces mucosus TaxID=1378264 RepID=A0A9P8PVV1_9ASCO|nr:hypothetical protein WICMUC_001374 [Wickerhamomyces mucosus]